MVLSGRSVVSITIQFHIGPGAASKVVDRESGRACKVSLAPSIVCRVRRSSTDTAEQAMSAAGSIPVLPGPLWRVGVGYRTRFPAGTGGDHSRHLNQNQAAHGDTEREDRLWSRVRQFLSEFKKRNGAITCRELLGVDAFSREGREEALRKNLFVTRCTKYVRDGIEILDSLGS